MNTLVIMAFQDKRSEDGHEVALTPKSQADADALRDALGSRRIDEAMLFPSATAVAIPAAKIAQSLGSPHGQRHVAKIADPALRAKLDELRTALSSGVKAAFARVRTD